MELFHIGFLDIRLVDVIDILLVALILYRVYLLVRGSAAISIFIGIMLVYFAWLLVRALHMELLGSILGQVTGVGVLALLIVFQQEIRRFLMLIGSKQFLARFRVAGNLFPWQWKVKNENDLNIAPVVKACRHMSRTKTGAIIVLARSSDMSFYASTGDSLDAALSKRLIENIFYKGSPLHDGAIIISGNKIKAARCVLPITENQELPARLGMRHRAAIGITEQSDAVVVIVSEETGEIAVAKEGQITTGLSAEELEKELAGEFSS